MLCVFLEPAGNDDFEILGRSKPFWHDFAWLFPVTEKGDYHKLKV